MRYGTCRFICRFIYIRFIAAYALCVWHLLVSIKYLKFLTLYSFFSVDPVVNIDRGWFSWSAQKRRSIQNDVDLARNTTLNDVQLAFPKVTQSFFALFDKVWEGLGREFGTLFLGRVDRSDWEGRKWQEFAS